MVAAGILAPSQPQGTSDNNSSHSRARLCLGKQRKGREEKGDCLRCACGGGKHKSSLAPQHFSQHTV
jgi:hypothetical protein